MKTDFLTNNVISMCALAQNMKSRQTGFSLIEVLIAALILSFAILGVASLQIIGMKGTHQSVMKQQAMDVAHNLIERMRVNHPGVIAGNYTLDSASFNCSSTVPNCFSTSCTASQIALVDKYNLVCGYGSSSRTGGVKITDASDNAMLVNGTLKVACNGASAAIGCSKGDVQITVGWTERALDKETPPVSDSLIIDTRIAAP